MTIRDKIQQKAIDKWYVYSKKGVVLVAPRVGKTFLATNIFKKEGYNRITIIIPRNDIIAGWKDTFQKLGFNEKKVRFITSRSFTKLDLENDEIIVVDEIHELSVAQLKDLDRILKPHMDFLGLTGTMTESTKFQVNRVIGVPVCYEYTINEAVRDGILCDYSIRVIKIPLDNEKPLYGKKTEAAQFRAYEFVKQKLKAEGSPYFFMELKQINILQNSRAKRIKTRELLHSWRNERVIVFCGTSETADDLEIATYHSKSKDKQVLKDFCEGRNYNHLASIMMLQAGITIKPINKCLVNYISGASETAAQKLCRVLAYEYDNPSKVAEIVILCADTYFEKTRIETALNFFDKNKITYE